MKLTETERISMIVKLLLANKTYLDMNEIMGVMDISRRNAYYALDEVNRILDKGSLNPIHTAYGKGMYLDEDQKNYLMGQFSRSDMFDIYSFSADEREACYYCEMFCCDRQLKITNFEELFKISRYTVLSDINDLKEKASSFELTIQYSSHAGYHVSGKEINRRKAFMSFFSLIYSIYKERPGLFDEFSFLDKGTMDIYQEMNAMSKSETEDYYDCSLLALASILNCVKKHPEKRIIPTRAMNYQPEIWNNEQAYISRQFPFLSDNEVSYFACYLSYSRMGQSQGVKSSEKITHAVKRMTEIFYLLTAISIDDDEFVKQLAEHLELAYQRYRLGIAIDNPLLDQIKMKYGDYFEIVRKAAIPIEEMIHGPIGENEIGFLTLYFAGQSAKKKKEVPKIKTVVICLNGLSTSYLLKNEIENLDSRIEVISCIGLTEYRKQNINKDLVVSTVQITPNQGDRMIVIHPILTFDDKTAIGNVVNKIIFSADGAPTYTKILDVVKPYITNEKLREASANLRNLYDRDNQIPVATIRTNDIFRPEYVSIAHEDDDWEMLIRRAALPLMKEGYIGIDYVDEIINNIHEYGSYMVFKNGYLLGHASADKSRRLGLSFLRLNNHKKIMESDVGKILILTPNDYTSHLSIVYRLLDIFNSNEVNRRIEEASESEIYRIINQIVFGK